MGSQKGEIAMIELSTMGIVQRIPSPSPRTKVRSLLFPSSTVLLALMNEGGVNSRMYFFVPEADASSVKWKVDHSVAFKNHTFCCMHFKYGRCKLHLHIAVRAARSALEATRAKSVSLSIPPSASI